MKRVQQNMHSEGDKLAVKYRFLNGLHHSGSRRHGAVLRGRPADGGVDVAHALEGRIVERLPHILQDHVLQVVELKEKEDE